MDPWLSKSIPRLLDEQAQALPDQEAFAIDGRRMSYRELARESARIARRLMGTGVGPGSHVAVLMDASAEFVLLHYAVLRTGAIFVPVNFNFKGSELEYALRQADCTHLIFGERVAGHDFWADLEQLTGGFPASAPGVLAAPGFPKLRTIACLGRSGRSAPDAFPAVLDYDALVGGDDPGRAEELAQRQAAIDAGDVSCILLTSGSTGFPKLAQVTHRSLVGVAHYYNECLGIEPGARLLGLFTLYHIGGLGFGVANALSAGACLIASRVFDPGAVLKTIEREQVTVSGFFDTHVTRIMGHPDFGSTDLSSIRSALFGGTPSTYERLHRDWGIPLVSPNFASTETGASIALIPRDLSEDAPRRLTNGRPLPGILIRVVDPETQREAATGESGEIRVKGWSVCKGYYNQPEQNAESFDADGYFCTGDIGHFDADGYLHYTGRYKMMVKTGGENVSEIEVENFLAQLVPGLRAVRVVGIPDALWGEAVTAFVELEPGIEPLSSEALRALCKRNVAAYKVPRHVLYLRADEWPVNTSGKVSKPDLRKIAIARLAAPVR